MKASLISVALAFGGLVSMGVQDPEPTPLAAGDAAPKFTLNDQNGQFTSIGADPEGWTLIAFYPKALTGG